MSNKNTKVKIEYFGDFKLDFENDCDNSYRIFEGNEYKAGGYWNNILKAIKEQTAKIALFTAIEIDIPVGLLAALKYACDNGVKEASYAEIKSVPFDYSLLTKPKKNSKPRIELGGELPF